MQFAYDGLMRTCLAFTLALYATGCGEVVDKPIDASVTVTDTPRPDAATADAAPDAPSVPCTYVPATSSSQTVLTYTLAGGSFQSYGCAPIDPTYWLSGSGMSVTVTFAAPQVRPSIRVWGMNTDDTASVTVNGNAYSLNANTASFTPKVVCGVSPGPDGVTFSNGMLSGANTPSQGNYSYQDVIVQATGVMSIRITGQTGAGWGLAGASVGCAN